MHPCRTPTLTVNQLVSVFSIVTAHFLFSYMNLIMFTYLGCTLIFSSIFHSAFRQTVSKADLKSIKLK